MSTTAFAISDERLPNEVEILLKRIKEIQDTCEHEWKRIEPEGLNEVRSDKIYTGRKTYRGTNPTGELYKIFTVCIKCNSTYNWDPEKTCFQCLGELALNKTCKGYIFDTVTVIDDKTLSGIYCHVHRKHCEKCDIDILFNIFQTHE